MAHLFKSQILNSEQYPLPELEPAPMRPPVPFVDEQAVTEAAHGIEHINSVISQLAPQVEQLAAMASEQARREGYEHGRAQAHAELADTIAQAAEMLRRAGSERQRVVAESSGRIAELSLKVASKVIGEQVQLDPSIVTRIVERTIADLEATADLSVRVNPEDLPQLEQQRATLERLLGGSGQLSLIADASIERGGCIVGSVNGEVDATVAAQLAVLQAAFAAQQPIHAADSL